MMFAYKLPSFFKINRPQQFDYKPFYYDAVKERVSSRHKETKNNSDLTSLKTTLKSMEYDWRKKREYHHLQKQSTFRLIVIIILLSLIVFLLLK